MLKQAFFFLALSATASAADASHTYIVRLHDAPLLEHARAQAQQRGLVRDFGEKAGVRRQLDSADSAEYLHRLDAARADVLGAARAALGRTLFPRHVFRHAANGMALTLTEAEAAQLAKLPGVVSVRKERHERPLTDAGPQWIGADKLWSGQVSGIAATKGEGVVIGIVDTGINPTHPAFAAHGGDGYTATNPRGHFYGLCVTGQATCNNKLIGIYDFTDEGTKGVDSVGHGSHVAGIAAGNAITGALQGHTVSLQRPVSGVAPHANIIMYKACTLKDGGGTCAESDLVAALDQATADGVDVINYSIGGDAIDPYALLDAGDNDATAMLQARASGIVVVVAAGNEGPGPHSIDEPGNAPWVISVANASHNRRFANSIGNFSGTPNPPLSLSGQGFTAGYGPAKIVYAGNYGNALCGVGDSEGVNPTGASNPFAANTFHGEIVICDRGTYARVEKGYNVLQAGAGGYVLANTPGDGESVVSDDHFLPAVHLGFNEGEMLKEWVATGGAPSGTITGVNAVLNTSYGDVLNASSSRGPTGFGVLKPDITAPGSNILSAAVSGNGEALMTGTSMASPHVAGAAALVIAAHPNWATSQVESALIGTALAGSVRKEDATTFGTPLDAGAGRVQPASAAQAGLYLPLSTADISAQNPAQGGKPENLNRPGIESESCLGQCSFTRKVADMSGGGSWQVSVTATDKAHVTVTPNQFTLAAGATQTLQISVDVSDPHLPGSWIDGRIVLHKSTGGQSANDFALPLAVYSSPGAQPVFQEFTTSGPGDSKTIQLSGLAALPQATFTPAPMVEATVTEMSLGVDAKSDDLYSTFPGTGKQFTLLPIVTSGQDESFTGSVVIAEVASSNAPSADLYVGIDYNGDGQPEFSEQACHVSSVAGAAARCVVNVPNNTVPPAAGASNAWVLVDIPKSTASGTYSVTISSGVPGIPTADLLGVARNFGVVGPGHVPAGIPFSLNAFWNADDTLRVPDWIPTELSPRKRYYGAVLIDGVQPQTVLALGQTGILPFSLLRNPGNDDMAATVPLSMNALESGESLRHEFIDVPANGTLHIDTHYIDATNTGPVTFYVARADFPAPSAAPDIAAAPAQSAAAAQWALGGSVSQKDLDVPVTPGRWYVVSTATGTAPALFYAGAWLVPSEQVVHPAPGAYYNPTRSGHGIFMNQAAGQQALYWYTYLQDGTPIWYQAVADVPRSTDVAWSAPLQQITWDGASVNATTTVGDAILTPINATEFMFSWHLYGQNGSEHFVLLGDDECVSVNGVHTDLTGQWYAPTQSGYGMDVLALPNLQFDAFYFYDHLGQPVWAAGDVEPFAPNATLQMLQYHGFCPLCAYVEPTTMSIGTLTTNFANAFNGNYAATLNLAPPLTGSWNINQPIGRLTGSTTCH